MKSTFREMRRAPVRVAASVLAIALAIAAIGVFAVPGVSEQTLRTIAREDRLTHLRLTTESFDELPEAAGTVDGLAAIEARSSRAVAASPGSDDTLLVVGLESDSSIDTWRVLDGSFPDRPGEVLVTDDVAAVGDEIVVNGVDVEVVGVGSTTWYATESAVVTDAGTADVLTGSGGFDEIVARLQDPTEANLEATVDQLAAILGDADIALTTFPEILPDGAHPIEEDIEQVSFMIGSLGVVAGIVALVLLASTTNAVVTERTRDAAIMQAVGGTRRVVRRDLRRLAVAIGVLGTMIGIPLGVVVANTIASMVLERFAGISPDLGIDVVVIAASAAFGILGARLVSGRVARRVTRIELATALRDRDAQPFGRRWLDRVSTRVPLGGLLQRVALRANVRRRARAAAISAQFAGAVAAAVLVASLGSSIGDFNTAELASFEWERVAEPANPSYPWRVDGDRGADAEPAIQISAEVGEWEVEVFGVHPDTVMIDRTVAAGSWLPTEGSAGEHPPAVVAERFGDQEGHAVGDLLTLELASGPATYEIVGWHPIKSVAIFAPIENLADDLGVDGGANRYWLRSDATAPDAGAELVGVTARDELFAEDAAARDAILGIFAAIGVIVVSIAALGAASTVAMNLYERRAEFATVQAVGGRRRAVVHLVTMELAPLAILGWAIGAALGILGAAGIMQFFAVINAIDLGFSVAWVAVPASAAAATATVLLLAWGAARQVARRPIAATLRAAA